MASTGLEAQLQELAIGEECEADCLPFRLPPDKRELQAEFREIPRYLFRVFSPRSQGITISSWVKSRAARLSTTNSKVNVFDKDDVAMAQMINRHLRWWSKQDEDETNLVSWTSSLLVALVYIFYLRASDRDGSTFQEIGLCVIDTSTFPEGVFLCDLDLIQCFVQYDKDLENLLTKLRSNPSTPYPKSYYFGEYLSQGSLKVQDKCKIVSAQDLVKQGLLNIRSEFKQYARWAPKGSVPWAKAVIEMRQCYYDSKTGEEEEASEAKRLEAVESISGLFEQSLRLGVAANLIAIALPQTDGRGILEFLRKDAAATFERSPPSKLTKEAHLKMPEVMKAGIFMQSAYRNNYLCKLNGKLPSKTTTFHDLLD